MMCRSTTATIGVAGLIGVAMIVAGTLVVATGQPAGGSATGARTKGRDLFMAHCASCHGASGRGDGPAADSLRRRPTDLTQYARMNGGVFPAERTRRVIDGRDVGAHGSVEMPVWGAVFKRTSPDGERAVRDRIDAIVAYLESLQERRGDDR
jgi:mono/diheme cytochrome c family protein